MHDTTDSFNRAVAVTPSDTVPISFGAAPPNPGYARRLFIGSAGAVTLITLGGDTVQYVAQAGTYIRINCTQVKASGTVATGIIAEY